MTNDHQRLAAIRELADQLQGCSLDEIQMLGRCRERLVDYREPAAARDPAAPRDLARERRRALVDALFLDVMDEERRRGEAARRRAEEEADRRRRAEADETEEADEKRRRAEAEAAHRDEVAQWGDPQQTVFSTLSAEIARNCVAGEQYDGVEITPTGGGR
jgi:hypothetical protein